MKIDVKSCVLQLAMYYNNAYVFAVQANYVQGWDSESGASVTIPCTAGSQVAVRAWYVAANCLGVDSTMLTGTLLHSMA